MGPTDGLDILQRKRISFPCGDSIPVPVSAQPTLYTDYNILALQNEIFTEVKYDTRIYMTTEAATQHWCHFRHTLVRFLPPVAV